MLYVPLLFYLFDQLAEGKDKNVTTPAASPDAAGDVAAPPPAPQDGH